MPSTVGCGGPAGWTCPSAGLDPSLTLQTRTSTLGLESRTEGKSWREDRRQLWPEWAGRVTASPKAGLLLPEQPFKGNTTSGFILSSTRNGCSPQRGRAARSAEQIPSNRKDDGANWPSLGQPPGGISPALRTPLQWEFPAVQCTVWTFLSPRLKFNQGVSIGSKTKV